MTREITHMKAFTAAMESLGKDSVYHRPDSTDAGEMKSYTSRCLRVIAMGVLLAKKKAKRQRNVRPPI